MGIPQFYRKLKTKCPEAIVENNKNLIDNQWDYIFLDFQSMIYSTYYLFSNEINYLFRLIYYINYQITHNLSINNSNYRYIIDFILNKHENYFKQHYNNRYHIIKSGLIKYNLEIIKEFILYNDYNNEDIIINILSENVILLVKQLSDFHIKSEKKYSQTFIFFDGIPSRSKIKEQLLRKIYPEIMKYIKEDLKQIADPLELELENILLNDNPPSIGIDKPIIYKINDELKNVNDPSKGKFNINELHNYGEAEHQIMKYLNTYIKKFEHTNILLVSPDADLILLCVINNTKHLNIDILKIDINLIDKYSPYQVINGNVISPFYCKYNYIYIKKIIKCLELKTSQEQLDVSYILLLLGDDFLPIVPTLTINSLDDIIRIYKTIKINIITDNKLNYNNFIILIKHLNAIQTSSYVSKSKIFFEKENLLQLHKIYFYSEYNNIEFKVFDKLYYLSKGIYNNESIINGSFRAKGSNKRYLFE